MPLIRLEKASVAFGSRPLLEKVDFLIDPGERVGLVGLNGAGKSTLDEGGDQRGAVRWW